MGLVQDALAALERADRGEVAIDGRLDDVRAGDVTFRLADCWTVVVFNDCGDWDYIDGIESPAGDRLDFDSSPDRLRHWTPTNPARWGIAVKP